MLLQSLSSQILKPVAFKLMTLQGARVSHMGAGNRLNTVNLGTKHNSI